VNRYDFLLVFKDPESMIKKQDEDGSGEGDGVFSPLINLASGAAAIVSGDMEVLSGSDGVADDEQISCRRARTIWRLATPGPDSVKDAAEVSFNKVRSLEDAPLCCKLDSWAQGVRKMMIWGGGGA
jgi:hypothetical protein